MEKLARLILRRRTAVIVTFLALAAVAAVLWTGVTVNDSMADYLPEDAPSTVALRTMEEEFTQSVPNARVMVPGVTVREALTIKEKLAAIDGVTQTLWLDDVLDPLTPVEVADQDIVETYYKDGTALISVTIENGREIETIAEIRALITDAGAIEGDAVHSAVTRKMAGSEALKAALFLIPLILVLLLFTTRSWLEPLLFLVSIGVSVLISMGMNFFFGDISFMTSSVAPVLQLAVSLDYAIFLLTAYREARETESDPMRAMLTAMKRSFTSVSASALTTIFGFLALVCMRFRIGADLGLNLAKGVVLSLISVMVFLPALTIACTKLLDRTVHKSLLPSFDKPARVITKLRIPALILVLIFVVPSYLAQSRNLFTYGMGELEYTTREAADERAVRETFGRSVATVVLVPKGDPAREALLSDALTDIPHVTGVVSYASMVGAQIPTEYLDADTLSQFYSDNYARLIVYADTDKEGDDAFAVVESVRGAASMYYDGALTLGESVSLYDMRDSITSDATLVNWLAIAAIALVLLLTFRSISLPVILVMTIETSIWINLAVPYFKGTVLCYTGFLIINTVQLGATVDYAILFTDLYREYRQILPPLKAVTRAASSAMPSILTSACILAGAGFILQLVSTNDIVSQLGGLLGRGTALSAAMVCLFLPAALTFLDPVIRHTTLGFLKKEDVK